MIKILLKGWRELRKASRNLDFAKVFDLEAGQVVVMKMYPQMLGEPYELKQITMVEGKNMATITSVYNTEQQLNQAFDDFTQETAAMFNKQISKLL